MFANAAGRHARHRLLQHPARTSPPQLADEPRETRASGCSTRRSPVARRAPRTPRCRSWSAARPTDFAAAKPLLDAVGKTVVHVGPNGAGQTVKAANQLIVGANIQVLAEALVFLEAYGVDTEAALRGARRRPGRLEGARPEAAEHARPLASTPASGSTCTTRTWASSPRAAREAGVVLPVGAIVAQLMASARASGDGGLDHSALLRGVERLAGKMTGASQTPTPIANGAHHMARMTAAQAAVEILRSRGRHPRLRAARSGDQPVLQGDEDQRRPAPHARPARRGRLAHGRGLHPRRGRATSACASAPAGRPAPT